MTVNEALKELQKIKDSGFGNAELLIRDTRSGVTEELSSIGDVSVYDDSNTCETDDILSELLDYEDEYVLIYI